MSQHVSRRRRLLATLTSATLVLGVASLATPALSASAAGPDDRPGLTPAKVPASAVDALEHRRPASLAHHGRSAYLLQLSTQSTTRVFDAKRPAGLRTARTAARAQLDKVEATQAAVISDLPPRTPVLYKTHAVLPGVAVLADANDVAALSDIQGVSRVLPITPKSISNSYAVPLQGAPAAWTGTADLGQNTTVAVIDTGIDYTHADFGGPGTTAAYGVAHAAADLQTPVVYPDPAKMVAGHDFVGDDYNPSADPKDPKYQPVPHPDPNPLDCEGHGSHVAGSIAGLGENADGTTYAGAYNNSAPFGTMKIGPGMAPAAKLMALKVFGCEGETDVITDAIDWAADPDGDPGTDDAVDVINMSLGSDYGSPDDADAVAVDAASALGITVAVSSGNSFGVYDVGGSPGTARRAITVAASVDAQSIVDGLHVTDNGAPATYASTRSADYDWETKPDLAGTVAVPTDNLTGCDPFDATDAAAIIGKIALLTWTDDNLECGSVTRSGNVKDAGGIGFVFASNLQTFSAGISGSDTIPGVLVNNAGGDAMRAAITGGHTVVVTGTQANEVKQTFTDDDDTMTDFSSRGIRVAGNVKPDVTAVGGTVFSTAVGTGDDGISDSGTSMAAPMVAGLAALVRSKNPTWTPEQVKADIMNTAGQDLDTNGSATPGGDRFAPNRVGSGRIQAVPALANEVLAYVADDPGAVSVSWGPVEVSGPTTMTKTVNVQNTGSTSRTYDVTYDEITSVPGVSYQVSSPTVTVAGGDTQTVTVTLSIPDPSVLTKTVDPTHGRDAVAGPDTLPQQTLADASGNLVLTPTVAGPPELRVPVYSAPRPVSDMTQATRAMLKHGTGLLTLSGHELGWDNTNGVGDADADNDIASLAAGLELQATDPAQPSCSTIVTDLCIATPEDRGYDVKYVGVTSDAPLQSHPAHDGTVYFGVVTHGPHSTFARNGEMDILIDTNGDKRPDLIAFNDRLEDNSDIMVEGVYDVAADQVVDLQLVNAVPGSVDTAFYDSDVVLLPVALSDLVKKGVSPAKPRISYGIVSSSAHGTVDTVAINASTGRPTGRLTADVFHPGVLVTHSGVGPIVPDRAAESIRVGGSATSYVADHGRGLLMLHFHNAVGHKAQVVGLSMVALKVPTRVDRNTRVTLTVTVPRFAGGPVPTGSVAVRNGRNQVVASGHLSSGTAKLSFRPKRFGSLSLHATYAGNATYSSASSASVSVRVTKAHPTVRLGLSSHAGRPGRHVRATVVVPTVGGIPPTGRVVIKDGSRTVGSARLVHGRAWITFVLRTHGKHTLRAVYVGDRTYFAGASHRVTYTVRR